MAKKKKTNIYEQHKQRYWEAYNRAGLVKEKYPQLKHLTIDMTFREPDWGDSPHPQQRSFDPNSNAFFELECPYVECVRGGFNLSAAVDELIQRGEKESSGSLLCQGWQDRERIGQYRCLLKMDYKITVTYE